MRTIASSYEARVVHPDLGADFFDPVEPARFPRQTLRYRNDRQAASVGLHTLGDEAWIAHFAGFRPLPGNLEQPLALRYHGHQFRHYNPDLGDGRGFLFAQLRDGAGRILDLATKGSGTTPWSRGGDGRLTLKGGVREVLATALLEALGVDTSKSFSLIETGEALTRNDEPSPTRSSVLVRLSHSHIRFGTFQRQASLNRPDNITKLIDHSVRHYFPELGEREGDERTAGFLRCVIAASAGLAASWMAAGFVHGVLNTDNLNITGESFDYGPYRFMPTLDPDFTAAYFDQTGLYAYGRQPEAVLWNLTRLAETLLLVCDKEPLVEALEEFEPAFFAAYTQATVRRLGLLPGGQDGALTNAVTKFLHESQVGFERFFFDWYGADARRALASPEAGKYRGAAFEAFEKLLVGCEPRPRALQDPYFAGEPCTLLIEEVEALWERIAAADDWSMFERKLEEIERMRCALHPEESS